jgi:hypothetical protein
MSESPEPTPPATVATVEDLTAPELAVRVQRAVEALAWPEVDQIRRRGDRRGARHRVATALIAACLLLLAGALTLRTGAPSVPSPEIGASWIQGPVNLGLLRQVSIPTVTATMHANHGADPTLLAVGTFTVGHGSLWMIKPGPDVRVAGRVQVGPGELERIDERSSAVVARWTVVALPVAVAVTDRYVWVAGDPVRAPGADPPATVDQFDLAGALVHTYSITFPVALAADGDGVWVESGTSSARRLHDGVADPPLTLSASALPSSIGTTMVVCRDGLYVATQDTATLNAYVDHFAAFGSGGAGSHHVLSFGANLAPVLACAPNGGVMIVGGPGQTSMVRHWSSHDGSVTSRPVAVGSAIGTDGTGVWLAELMPATLSVVVSRLDSDLRPVSGTFTIAGAVTPPFVATDGAAVWIEAVVGQFIHGSTAFTTVFDEIAADEVVAVRPPS